MLYQPSECKLLDGFDAYFIQFILGLIALGTLWYKRYIEKPKRSLEVWSMDISKQAIGAITVHFINIFISMALPPYSDECIWYFINFQADFTLGTLLALFFLMCQQQVSTRFNWESIKKSGDYGDPPSYKYWFFQMLSWLGIVIFSKMIVVAVIISGAKPFAYIGNYLFSHLHDHPLTELLIVMVICPCFSNIIQFWVQDSFLKKNDIMDGKVHNSILPFKFPEINKKRNYRDEYLNKKGLDPSLKYSLLPPQKT